MRAIAEDDATAEALFLVKNNVPFDVAFSLSACMRRAWVIRMRLIDGASFDWSTMRFGGGA